MTGMKRLFERATRRETFHHPNKFLGSCVGNRRSLIVSVILKPRSFSLGLLPRSFSLGLLGVIQGNVFKLLPRLRRFGHLGGKQGKPVRVIRLSLRAFR